MSRLVSQLVGQRPSLLAAAAICLARATLGLFGTTSGLWPRHLHNCTGYKMPDLADTMRAMRQIHEWTQHSSTKISNGPNSQFNHATYLYVSRRGIIQRDVLDCLIRNEWDEHIGEGISCHELDPCKLCKWGVIFPGLYGNKRPRWVCEKLVQLQAAHECQSKTLAADSWTTY